MKQNDLVTHINEDPIQGLLHSDIVQLIGQSGKTIRLSVMELSKTSIRTGSKRKTIGSRVISHKLRSRSRNSSTEDSNRTFHSSKKSNIYKKLRKSSLRRTSSLKRASSKAGYNLHDGKRQIEESGTSSSPNSTPSSPNSQMPRPGSYLSLLKNRF